MITMSSRAKPVEVSETDSDLEELNKKIEKFWRIEAIGITDECERMTSDEKRALEIFEKTTTFENGRYKEQLPFKDDGPRVVNNYQNACEQMESTEDRLLKDRIKMQWFQRNKCFNRTAGCFQRW